MLAAPSLQSCGDATAYAVYKSASLAASVNNLAQSTKSAAYSSSESEDDETYDGQSEHADAKSTLSSSLSAMSKSMSMFVNPSPCVVSTSKSSTMGTPFKSMSTACLHQSSTNNKQLLSAAAGSPRNFVAGKPQPIQQQAPVQLIQFIFSRLPAGKEFLDLQNQQQQPRLFSKPSEKRMDAYDGACVRAVRAGDVILCRTLLREQGKSFDACNRFGESLLHMACRRGDEKMVRFLIEEGNVEVNTHDDFGRTPLHDALWTSVPQFSVVDILLHHVNPLQLLARDVRSHTPFQYARKEHSNAWVNFLKQRAKHIALRLYQLSTTTKGGTQEPASPPVQRDEKREVISGPESKELPSAVGVKV